MNPLASLRSALAVAALIVIATPAMAESMTKQEELGKKLYFDTTLSEPDGQSCASCHTPKVGFDDPDKHLPVSEGVIPRLFGGRNSPPSAYAMYIPNFHFDAGEGLWVGGVFWDGRATGDVTGDPLADQALGPFLNPVEMANPDKETVLRDVIQGDYKGLFKKVCGKVNLNNLARVEKAYTCIGKAIGAFERTLIFGEFTSKYDEYLKECVEKAGKSPKALDNCAKGVGKHARKVGKDKFSKDEWAGMQLFMNDVNDNNGVLDEGEGAVCVACHTADWTHAKHDYDLKVQSPDWAPKNMVPPLFTDNTYDNLGVPKSNHRLLRDNPVDLGLGGREDVDVYGINVSEEMGKVKVSSLRNIGITSPYTHNGFFKTLKDITHFYNTRDVDPKWDIAEVPETMNTDELGNLGLSNKQEKQLVKFMKTLTDK